MKQTFYIKRPISLKKANAIREIKNIRPICT
ncbi:MAG: hypothetical protein ACI9DO_002894, partial [Reinekea sp.]